MSGAELGIVLLVSLVCFVGIACGAAVMEASGDKRGIVFACFVAFAALGTAALVLTVNIFGGR